MGTSSTGGDSPGTADSNAGSARESRQTDDAGPQQRQMTDAVSARLPTGGEMTLDVPSGDDIGARIGATDRPYEAIELSIVDAFLPPKPSIIDVGANIGNHSIYWALTGQAAVTAFEPYPPALKLLNANIARNSVTALVTSRNEAIGSSPGGAAPVPMQGNLGATRMSVDPSGPVKVISLNSLRSTHCDLLKVDVEGSELAVLQGASDILADLRPLVWVEVLTAIDDASVRELMIAHGYRSALMLSPTNVLFLPRRRTMLRIGTNRNAFLGFARRSAGRLARWTARRIPTVKP
jgi:FkbM family methyltransferase